MRIITDSAADFTREELSQYNIRCVQTGIIIGGQDYTADQLDEETFWQGLLAGESIKTSQPAPEAFLREFEAAKEAGEEAVCVCISSALSGTLQSARLAAAMLNDKSIHVIDALTGAAGQKLLVLHACRLRDEGRLLAGEIADKLNALRSRIRLFASLDTLDNLARSGRIPRAVASLGSLAQLKPLLHVTPEGKITLAGKAFGRHRAIDSLARRIASMRIDPQHPIIPLYSHTSENCRALIKKLSSLGVFADAHLLSAIGPSIAPHIGPGAYGVTFVEAE